MAFRYRSDIVGKRFLGVKRGVKLKPKEYQNWDWQSGVIRASSDRDYSDPELTILAEFTNQDWKKRQAIRLKEEYQLFLVEKTLVNLKHETEDGLPPNKEGRDISIAINFEAIIGHTVHNKLPQVPVVLLVNLSLWFVKESSLTNHQLGDPCSLSEIEAVRSWYEYQESQQLMLQTPTVLVGYRARVYRAEGTTQWYTAVIQSYCEKTQELVVTDDTVLEEHREDPALLEIHLLGDRVIESILRGDDIRVRPSRTCRSQEKGSQPDTRLKSTSLKRRSYPGKVEDTGNQLKKGEKHVKRSSLPIVQKNSDRENKKSSSSSPFNRTVSRRTKSQENFEVALRDADNHTPTKSLIVPLLDISPKKFRERKESRDSVCSSDRGDKFVLNRTGSTKIINSSADSTDDNSSNSSVVGRSAKVVGRVDSAKKRKKCDTKSPGTADKKTNKKLVKSTDIPGGTTCSNSNTKAQEALVNSCDTGKSTQKVGQSSSSSSLISDSVDSSPLQEKTIHKNRPGKSNNPCRSSSTATSAKKLKNPGSSCKSKNNSSSRKKSSACDNNKRPGCVSGKEKSKPVESKSIDKPPPPSSSPSPSQYHNNKAVVSTDSSCCSREEKPVISEAQLITQECSRHKQNNTQDLVSLGSSSGNDKPQKSKEDILKKSQPSTSTADAITICSTTSRCTLLQDNSKTNLQAAKVNNISSDIDSSSSAQVIIQDSRLLSDCGSSSNKCIGKRVGTIEGSCSGVDSSLGNSLLCEGKVVNLHSQECSQYSVTHAASPSKRTTDVINPAASPLTSSSHGANNSRNPSSHIPPQTLAEESKDMYYKKTLLGDYQRKESGGQASPEKAAADTDKAAAGLSTAGINLNQSLTDQLARRGGQKPDPRRSWEDVMKSTSSNGLDLAPKVSDSHTSLSLDLKISPSVSSGIDRRADAKALEAAYHLSVHTDKPRTTDDPGRSKSAEPKPGPSQSISSGHNSLPRDLRTEDRSSNTKDRDPSSKSSNSPLLVDKARPVEPYRDPELLKKDELFRIQAIQKQQQAHVPLTHPSMNPPPNVPPALPGHPSSHAAAHPMLSHMSAAAAAAAAAGGVAPLPSQIAAIQEQAFAAQINYLRSLAMHQQTPLTPLTFTGIQNPYQTRQLEMLWQQKFPNIQVPPGWLLHQYQDELLRDVSHVTPGLLQHREMLDREREMREREMALERERMDREMREREERERAAERERIERERQQERERQERERQDRERREREERERQEVEKRERQERERREKERQQEQQRERERREILHESKAAADAVEKHFQESLNRLSQQRALSTGTWFPGGPNPKPSPLQSLSNPSSKPPYPPGTSAFSSVAKPPHNSRPSSGGGMMDRKVEDKPKHGEFSHPHPASSVGSGRRMNHSPVDMKPKLSPQDLSHKPRSSEQQDTKPAITLRESLIKGFPSEPVNLRTENKAFPGYPSYPGTTAASVAATTSASGSSSSTAGHQIKQEPNFSLYGYPYQQPTQQMYISQDKLVKGLKEEKGIKQEPTDLRKPPLSSPPPLVKTEQKPVLGSGGGDTKPDVRSLGHGSITLGTSRGQALPQQDSKAGLMVASSSNSSPMRVSSPQQLLQSMKGGQPLPSLKGHIPLSSAAQTTAALTMAMQQAYIVAMAQQNSMGNMAMPHHAGSPLPNQSKERMPELSPNSQKRRAQMKDSSGLGQDKKKTKVDPGGPLAQGQVSGPNKPPSTGTYIDSFKSFVENAVQSAFLQDSDVAERMRLNPQFMQHLGMPPKPYDTPQQHRQQLKQSPSNKDMAAAVTSSSSIAASNAISAASSTVNTTSTTSSTLMEDSRKLPLHPQQQQPQHQQSVVPPFVPQSQLPPSTTSTSSTTAPPLPPSATVSRAGGVTNTTALTAPSSSSAGTTTSLTSVNSSISSIQDTINRVANGTMDTDSDTLSAPSPPPPTLKSSTDAPSPVRLHQNPSKPSFKKAILARYSEDSVPCPGGVGENSNSSSLCEGAQSPPKIDRHIERMETSSSPHLSSSPGPHQYTCSSQQEEKAAETPVSKPQPPTPVSIRTPLDLLKETEREEMTTSASEAEQQDCDGKAPAVKGKKKTSKRKSEGAPTGGSSKKQKAVPQPAVNSNSDPESGPNTDPPTKKKKKNNGKNKSEETENSAKAKDTEVKQEPKDDSSSGNSRSNTPASNPKTKANKDSHQARCTNEVNTSLSSSSTSVNSTVASTIGSNASSVLSSVTSALAGTGKTASPLMMETDRDLKKQVKVEEKPTEVVKPKKSAWDCEKKLKDWEKKQAQREKESKKGKKGEKGSEKSGANGNKGDSGQDKDLEDNPSSVLANKPLNKDPVNKLKKNQEPFLQDASCGEIAPKLMKCRECKMRNKKLPNIFCRFYAFRRLKYNPKGCVSIAGFSEPSDADVDDIELWYPRFPPISPTLDLDMAKYVMANLGDRFCELVEQEKEAMMWVSPDSKIVWKRAVQGVREMCDVCDTTLFNMHWCCHKCGFVVCIDCYRNKAKKTGSNQDKSCKVNEEATSNQKWLTCSANRQQHEPDKLKITQIIPSDVLWALGSMIHEVRDNWNMQSNCPCGHTSKVNQVISGAKNGMVQHLFSSMHPTDQQQLKDRTPLVNGIGGSGTTNNKKKPLANSLLDAGALNGSPLMSPLNILAEAAASRESETKKEGGGGGGDSPANTPTSTTSSNNTKDNGNNNQVACSTLRDLLTRQGTAPAGGVKGSGTQDSNSKKPKGISGLGDILQEVVEKNHQKSVGEDGRSSHNHHANHHHKTLQMSHYKPRCGSQMQGRSSPIPMYTLKETSVLYPDITHSWLDQGRLLRLHDPRCSQNMRLFQQQWRRGQPVIVSHCDKSLDENIWTPKAFGKEFGELENDLVNCSTGVTMLGHKMKVFWDGFQRMGARLKDGKNRPLILKLKDWPPTEDFSDLMPSRFQDLMQALPLPEYTQRTGTFNLATRLPEFFVKPDLGPKMYNAYGSAMHPKTGSTNLHLDMSDAVNLMIYVGIPEDDVENQQKAAMETMEEAGCCQFTKDRARTGGEKPGALWHIFDALDADKIRDLLNKVAVERGEKIDLNHDPIHDQAWYLNTELRQRLLSEYGVQGYSIVQYLGDAVFIPAGAPHQVKNLHSCIKAAEDFVSPENINHCFKMTQEFRYLSETHSNHEDKLQIKNIIYHAVKDAVAVLKENDPTAEMSV